MYQHPTWLKAKLKQFYPFGASNEKYVLSGELMKHKAQLCTYGGMQKWGVDFWETYSPILNWITVMTLLAIAAINDLPTSLIDFVLAFPQAELDVVVFMKLLIGIDVQQGHAKDYILHLN
eukprot:757764-Ditylum_brightwellii.AAC.1